MIDLIEKKYIDGTRLVFKGWVIGKMLLVWIKHLIKDMNRICVEEKKRGSDRM